MVFRAEKWRSSGGSIDRTAGGLYSEFGHSDPNFGRRRLILQPSGCRVLVRRFIPGGENERRGQEVESDANWVPSYAGEAGGEAEEDEEAEKEAADDIISARRRTGKGKEKVCYREEILTVGSEYEQMDNLESDGDNEPSAHDAAGDDEIPDEGTSQSAEKRTRKKKKRSDIVEGELETSGRFREKAYNRNYMNLEIHDADSQKERGAAGETKPPGRKKRKYRKESKGHEIDWESEDAKWVKSLRGPQLRLMQALKELGTERVNTTREDSLYNCLTPTALRVIGIILEEHVKEQLSLLDGAESGDGEEQKQNEKSSSPNGLRSADKGHRVDGANDTQTDNEVDIRRKRRKKPKSPIRSYQAIPVSD